MSDITFARWWVLLALLLIPALAGIWAWATVRARRRGQALSRTPWPRPPYLATTLFLTAATLAIVAAAQPRWGEKQSEVARTGSELIVVLDVSRSMEARDIPPSRIEATKTSLTATLSRLGGDRVGMVVFGGDARVRFPLTTDLAAALQIISTIETGPVIVTGGSSAAAGLDLALESFDTDGQSGRVILLITDGDDLGEDPASVSERLRAAGVQVLVAGAGTPEGGTVPVYDKETKTYTDKLDRDGRPIVTRLDEPFLRALAAAAGGRYIGSDLDALPGAVTGRLASLERTRFDAEQTPIPIERYQWFAGAALAVLVLASLIEWIPRPSRRAVIGGVAVGAALLAGCATRAHELNEEGRNALDAGDTERAISLFLEAQAESPDDPRMRLNLAAAYHRAGRYEEASMAARTLLLESDPGLRARAHASIGHHQFAAGNLEGALEAFKRALLENPRDRDSRHDYEVVLRLMEPPEPEEGETNTPGQEATPSATPANGNGEPGEPSASPGQPGNSQGPERPGTVEDIERRLADLDAQVARLIEEAGEDPDAGQALRILQLLAERQRIAGLRDALSGDSDPRDY